MLIKIQSCFVAWLFKLRLYEAAGLKELDVTSGRTCSTGSSSKYISKQRADVNSDVKVILILRNFNFVGRFVFNYINLPLFHIKTFEIFTPDPTSKPQYIVTFFIVPEN